MVNNNKIQNKPSVLRASIFALDHTLSQFYSSYVAKILVENFFIVFVIKSLRDPLTVARNTDRERFEKSKAPSQIVLRFLAL